MPAQVRIAQVLMYVVAALTLLLSVAALVALGMDTESLGVLMLFMLPGIASCVLALLIPRRSRAVWIMIIGLEIVYIMLAISQFNDGDLRGLTNLIIPVAILVLLSRRTSRDFFRGQESTSYFG